MNYLIEGVRGGLNYRERRIIDAEKRERMRFRCALIRWARTVVTRSATHMGNWTAARVMTNAVSEGRSTPSIDGQRPNTTAIVEDEKNVSVLLFGSARSCRLRAPQGRLVSKFLWPSAGTRSIRLRVPVAAQVPKRLSSWWSFFCFVPQCPTMNFAGSTRFFVFLDLARARFGPKAVVPSVLFRAFRRAFVASRMAVQGLLADELAFTVL
jgi:hypothetical protein